MMFNRLLSSSVNARAGALVAGVAALLGGVVAFAPSSASASTNAARASHGVARVAPDAEAADSSRFMRFRKMPGGGGVLETSIVTYQNDEGDTVDLIGAVHVGDAAYYGLLNEQFASYDSLLYEMVKPKDLDIAAPRREAAEDIPFALQMVGGLQKAMQMALELDFQTEAVDYSPANFVHADLDMETFLQLQDERGEGFLQMMVQQMLNNLGKTPDPDYQPVSLFEIMEAMDAPDRARRLKLLFARELSNMDDMTGMMGEDSVILGERNKKAVEVIDERLEMGERRLGLFYGAAHMPGIDKLLKERGFEQVGEPVYLTAWDMTPDGSASREMKQRLRAAIVDNAAADAMGGRDPAAPGLVDGDDAAAAAAMLRSMRDELDALRSENDSLRTQLDAVRKQNDALRERLEGEE